MSGWGEFGLALTAFLLSHAVPARPALRARFAAAIGLRGYLVLYSLISLGLLGWLVVAAERAPFVPLWPYAAWQGWVPGIVMLPACLLVAFGVGAANPLSLGGRSTGFDPSRPGIAGVARHPLLWALALWAGAHVLPNGNLAHVILFGSFAAFPLVGMGLMDRRRRRALGQLEWERLARATSSIPLAALAGGRWRPSGWPSPLRLLAGLALYAGLVLLHRPVIGVGPLPGL
jgi:uncharacterized membrane protein